MLVRELMKTYGMVFWVDADALIVDIGRDILTEIRDEDDVWFARHPQGRDPNATVLNAGIILARSTEFTESLFDAMWNAEQSIDHNW